MKPKVSTGSLASRAGSSPTRLSTQHQTPLGREEQVRWYQRELSDKSWMWVILQDNQTSISHFHIRKCLRERWYNACYLRQNNNQGQGQTGWEHRWNKIDCWKLGDRAQSISLPFCIYLKFSIIKKVKKIFWNLELHLSLIVNVDSYSFRLELNALFHNMSWRIPSVSPECKKTWYIWPYLLKF